METVLLLLLLLTPLVGFVINQIGGKKLGKTLPGIIATAAVTVSFVISLIYFIQILSTGQSIQIHLFEWISLGEFTVCMDFTLDQLSLLWLMFVTGIGALIHVYSIGYMHNDENISRYFSFLNLFIFFMSVLVTGSNLLVIFIGWEGVGLCSYLLIGFWYKNHKFNDSDKKAFIMNRIGDLGFLVGIFTLGFLFQSVDYDTMKAVVSNVDPGTFSLLSIVTLRLFIEA